MVRVYASGSGDLGSIPGRVIPKTLKMVYDASLLNTQHYKVQIKGKVEKSKKRSSVIYSHNKYAYIHMYMFMQHHNDTINNQRDAQ